MMIESLAGDSGWAGFDGIRVIGDVHGDALAFSQTIEEARQHRLFVIQLGDLVDRGADSVEALRLALSLVGRGDGLFLLGNHDDKLRRALRGNPVRVGVELRRTLDTLQSAPDAAELLPRVVDSYETAPYWLQLGSFLAVHAAFHPAMLTASSPKAVVPRRTADKCRWLALHGEGQGAGGDEGDFIPVRTYHWVDTVPSGVTVLIGHDTLSTETIVERAGATGGKVIFCDTGCGKGGRLSWVDLPVP